MINVNNVRVQFGGRVLFEDVDTDKIIQMVEFRK